MAIREYMHEGRTFFEITINVRSREIARIRKQRKLRFDLKGNRIENISSARAEEKRLLRDATTDIHRIEGKGHLWSEIVDRWEDEKLNPELTNIAPTTATDHAQLMRNWTNDWLRMPACEIGRGEVRHLLKRAADQGKSRKFQKTLKNTINVIYKWAIEERLIREVQVSPTTGILVGGREEEKLPEILTMDQVRLLLQRAFDQAEAWFTVWTTAFHFGARSGELQGIRREDLSLVSRERALEQDKLPADKRNYGNVAIQRSWSARIKGYTPTKGRYWRKVPVSQEMYWFLTDHLLKEDFGKDQYGHYLLPRIKEWSQGQQAAVLRAFSQSIGLPSIKFHTLRACFATHLLALGIPAVKVMKAGGWKDLKTMERYVRLAGIDVAGITEVFDVIPEQNELVQVANLIEFRPRPKF